MQPTIGRTLIFKITEEQAQHINRRRTTGESIAARIQNNGQIATDGAVIGEQWPIGAQAHIGNFVYEGNSYPLIVTNVWPDEFGAGKPGVNGQVILDGNDSLWVTSAGEGEENGQWQWPEKV
jgi:hypothetical protein